MSSPSEKGISRRTEGGWRFLEGLLMRAEGLRRKRISDRKTEYKQG